MSNSLPFELMSGVFCNSGTPTYGGVTVDLYKVYEKFSAYVSIPDYAGSGQLAVDVEGSLDGVNWYPVANVPNGATGNIAGMYNGINGPSYPARYIRAYGVVFSGSPSGTVTLTAVGING